MTTGFERVHILIHLLDVTQEKWKIKRFLKLFGLVSYVKEKKYK